MYLVYVVSLCEHFILHTVLMAQYYSLCPIPCVYSVSRVCRFRFLQDFINGSYTIECLLLVSYAFLLLGLHCRVCILDLRIYIV